VDEPRYLLGQVAAAAGITANLLKTWIVREVIVLGEHDRDAHGKGSSRVFTLRRTLIVAATAELVRLGMSTMFAGQTGKSQIDIELRHAKGDPLEIFSFTIFQPTTEYRRTIIAADPNLTVADILNFKDNHGHEEPDEGPAVSFMLLNLKALVERVLRRLGELDEPMDTKGT
jgi:hypothetical protein